MSKYLEAKELLLVLYKDLVATLDAGKIELLREKLVSMVEIEEETIERLKANNE